MKSKKISPELLFAYNSAALELCFVRRDLLAFLGNVQQAIKTDMDSYLTVLPTLIDDAIGSQGTGHTKQAEEIRSLPSYERFFSIIKNFRRFIDSELAEVKIDKLPTTLRSELDIASHSTKNVTQENLEKIEQLTRKYRKMKRVVQRRYVQTDVNLGEISDSLPVDYRRLSAKRDFYYQSKTHCKDEDEVRNLVLHIFPSLKRQYRPHLKR